MNYFNRFLKTTIVLCAVIVSVMSTSNTLFATSVSTKEITSFSFPEGAGVITETSIAVEVPYGTDVTNLTPTIVHDGVSVSPLSGVAHDFTEPVTYTVMASNESTQNYVVTVTVAAPRTTKDITSFSFPEGVGVIEGTTISVTVPYGTDLSELTPTIASTGESINPPSGEMQGFSSPRVYTVTAQDGSTKEYTVTVTVGEGPISITPPTGTYTSAQTVSMVAHTHSEVTVYYTLDGSTPFRTDVEGYEGSSYMYTDPFSIDGNDGEVKVVKARFFDGEGYSLTVTRTYTFSKQAPSNNQVVSGGGYFIHISSGGVTPPVVEQSPSPAGTVLGATASCKESGEYLTRYARIGYDNDVDTVKKLQQFLNKEIDANLPVTGFFGTATESAVKKFQLIHKDTLLAPWGITEPTGILYITTIAQINHLMCSEFPLTPMDTKLIPFNENPNTPKKL